MKERVVAMKLKHFLPVWILMPGLFIQPKTVFCGIGTGCQSISSPLVNKHIQHIPLRSSTVFNVPDTNKTLQQEQGNNQSYQVRELTMINELKLSALKSEGKAVTINWQCESQEGNKAYELQRSSNQEIWQTVYTKYIPAEGASQAGYAYMDQDPETPMSYYRVLVKKNEGDDQVSEVMPVSFREFSSMSISPNPARSYAMLNIYAVMEGKGEIQVLDRKGALHCHEAISVKEGENAFNLQLLRNLRKGMYTVRVVLPNDVLTSSLIVLK